VLSSADRAVLSSTAALLEAVRRQTLPYADDTWSPVGDLTLGMIAARLGAELFEAPLAAGVQEMGIPAYMGNPVVIVNHRIPPPARGFALRHGLAHLVAGELEAGQGADVRFMSQVNNWMSLEERRADLFALADLIPDRELRPDPEWLAGEISLLVPDWPAERVFDRVGLRLALIRF
jgi:Zn-dependent peptidase ImmA (M78 family)